MAVGPSSLAVAGGRSLLSSSDAVYKAADWRRALKRFREAWCSGRTDHIANRARDLAAVAHRLPPHERRTAALAGATLAIENASSSQGLILHDSSSSVEEGCRSTTTRQMTCNEATWYRWFTSGSSLRRAHGNDAHLAALMAWHNLRGEWSTTLRCYEETKLQPNGSGRALSRSAHVAAIHAYSSLGLWSSALQLLSRLGSTDATRTVELINRLNARWDVTIALHTQFAARVDLPPVALELAKEGVSSAYARRPSMNSQRGPSSDRVRAAIGRRLQHHTDREVPPSELLWQSISSGTSDWALTLRLSATAVAQEGIAALNAKSLAAVAHACAASGSWTSAAAILRAGEEAQPKDVVALLTVGVCVSLVVVLSRYGQTHLARRGLMHLRKAQVAGPPLHMALCAMLTSTHSVEGARQWEAAVLESGGTLNGEATEHFIELCAKSGAWKEALSRMLRWCESGTPTPKAHDHAQYGLSLAGAHWSVSVALLHAVHRAGTVDSEIAFKSVVSNCVDQGADDAAHAVLVTTMQRGVGRKT